MAQCERCYVESEPYRDRDGMHDGLYSDRGDRVCPDCLEHGRAHLSVRFTDVERALDYTETFPTPGRGQYPLW